MPGAGDLALEGLLESADLGLDLVLNFPRSVTRLALPRSDLLLFWDFFADPRHPAVLVEVMARVPRVRERYLRRVLQERKTRGAEGFRLFGVQNPGEEGFPATLARVAGFRRLARHLGRVQERRVERVRWRGRSWILVGFPGRLLPDYLLFALYPEDRIMEQILPTVRQAAVVGVFGVSRPATNLGGDYFDYGLSGSDHFFVLVGPGRGGRAGPAEGGAVVGHDRGGAGREEGNHG